VYGFSKWPHVSASSRGTALPQRPLIRAAVCGPRPGLYRQCQYCLCKAVASGRKCHRQSEGWGVFSTMAMIVPQAGFAMTCSGFCCRDMLAGATRLCFTVLSLRGPVPGPVCVVLAQQVSPEGQQPTNMPYVHLGW
jgi:hypothetical protein